tara:strand:- start:132 stop:542 length:411 start_codon:yes stop_codon:yes gene_type:complete
MEIGMLSALAIAALSASSPFVATFQNVDARQVNASRDQMPWERWSFTISNTSGSAQELRICPHNVDRVASDPARTTKRAFALAFGDASWSYNCIKTTIEGGASIDLRAYTRPYGQANSPRTLILHTSDGALIPAVD